MIKSKFSKDEITQAFMNYDVRRSAPLMICYSWRKKNTQAGIERRVLDIKSSSATELLRAKGVYHKKPR